MATVHLGRLLGPAGFARTVAIKRLHAQYAKDPDFVSMFLDEARLAARIRHPNVVSTLDVVVHEGEVFLVMEYVHGDSLAKLWRLTSAKPMGASEPAAANAPLCIVVAIMAGVLHGLHAAHEAGDEHGEPLHIIHRDVSPQNILVGADGVARVLDFGVAKAARRLHTTGDGSLKGKLRYMAPEQLRGEPIDRRVDIFSASIVLWEMLTGVRLFHGEEPDVYVARLLSNRIDPPRKVAPELPPLLDDIVMRGLAPDREDRFATARDMAVALENAVTPTTTHEVSEWVTRTLGTGLEVRAAILANIERSVEAQGATSVPEGLASRVQDAKDREARSRLATEVSLNGQEFAASAAPALAATEMTLSATVPTPYYRRPRAAFARLGVGLAAVAAATLWAVWSGAPASLRGAPAAGPPVEAKNDTPAAIAPRAAPSSASVTSVSAEAVEDRPGQTPPAAPPTPRQVRPPPTPGPKVVKPVASTRSTLCMKQRPDGIVYFEACP
jgi:serine/threonine protein kinase